MEYDFEYDVNGNMTKDRNKEIASISYNHLNLPVDVVFETLPQKISYVYDATGVKLKKSVTDEGTVTTEYAGNYIYNNAEDGTMKLQFLNHPEGYIVPVANTGGSVKGSFGGTTTYSSYSYVFQYKDHLGNVRLSYSDSNLDGAITQSEIIEESNYYPFGLEHKGYNNVVNGTENKYQTFQGQELEEELGKNTLAYQWRDYDPALGRFNKIDRFAEKYSSLTPYHFTANNPIFFREIAGDSINVTDIQSRTSGIDSSKSVADVLEDDLESTSGLSLSANSNGNLEYDTEKGFLGIRRAKVKRDANGKKIGSSKARRRLKRAIKNKETVTVKDNTGGGTYVPFGPDGKTTINVINYDENLPNFLMSSASSDLNKQSVGPALVFYHELDHTPVGGGRSDPPSNDDQRPGATARRSNQIRRQLGKGYGIRATYGTTTIGGTTYMPFSKESKKQLHNGTVPTMQYLKF